MIGAGGVFWALDHARGHQAPAPLNDPNARPREPAPPPPLDAEETVNSDVFNKVKPSVVNVDIVQRERVAWNGSRMPEQRAGTGSGFVWDDAGRVVTNYHVIAPVEQYDNLTVRVTLPDRTTWDAQIVGTAPRYDLAVLKFDPEKRPPADVLRKIELGTSGDLQVGQTVYAIGNPLGLSLSMTKGIISALDRPIQSPAKTLITGAIQTDAAINPGNSGGPLLNRAGQLIGVNTAIATTDGTGGNIGIGFAIPSDLVNDVVTKLIQQGRLPQPYQGVTSLVDQRTLRWIRFDRGVMVEKLDPNGPLAKLPEEQQLRGLEVNRRTGRIDQFGDIILSVNGQPINNHSDFIQAERTLSPGEQVKIEYARVEVGVERGRQVLKETHHDATATVAEQ
jgi:S1-C subfamily serine protease